MIINLRKNALWAVAEVVVSGLALFFLYRLIVGRLGIRALGIWSLVLATTSLGRLADLGMASGLSRFVAVAQARQDSSRTVACVETTIVTNALLFTAIAMLIWWPVRYALGLSMSHDALAQAEDLLPYALASFVLMNIAGATTGAIIGQQRSDQKSIIALVGLATQLTVAALLVPRFGLRALGVAQIAQYTLLITASWLLFLRNHFRRWTLRIPSHWRKDVFRELLGFGAVLQATTILGIAYEPAVKFLMSSLGGLEVLGFFEMSQRLLQQARQLLVMPAQTLVPTFAHLSEVGHARIEGLYLKATVHLMMIASPLLAGLAAASPLISYLWVGHVERTFVILTGIMAFGILVNLIAAPAYLLALGVGRVKWILFGNALTVAVVCLAGIALGRIAGGIGVAVAASIALASGGLLSMTMTCRSMGIHPFPRIADFRSELVMKLPPWLRPSEARRAIPK